MGCAYRGKVSRLMGTTLIATSCFLRDRPAHSEIIADRTGVLSFGERAGMDSLAKDEA